MKERRFSSSDHPVDDPVSSPPDVPVPLREAAGRSQNAQTRGPIAAKPSGSSRDLLLITLALFAASVLYTTVGVFIDNHAVQVPLVKLLNDPSLYPGDPFAEALSRYPSLLWSAVAVLARLVPLGPLLVVLFLLERLLVLYAAGRLARAFAPGSTLAAAGAMALFAFAIRPLLGLGTIVECYFEQTGFAVALLLLAIAAFHESRPVAWAVWTALAFNATCLYGAFALGYFGIVFLLDSAYRRQWRRWLLALGLFFLLSSYALVLALGALGHPLIDRKLWLAASFARGWQHLYLKEWPKGPFIVAGALLALLVLLLGLGGKMFPRLRRHALIWSGVAVGWLGLAYMAAYVLVSPSLLLAQPSRATDLWICFSAVAIVAIGAARVEAMYGDAREGRGDPLRETRGAAKESSSAVIGAAQLREGTGDPLREARGAAKESSSAVTSAPHFREGRGNPLRSTRGVAKESSSAMTGAARVEAMYGDAREGTGDPLREARGAAKESSSAVTSTAAHLAEGAETEARFPGETAAHFWRSDSWRSGSWRRDFWKRDFWKRDFWKRDFWRRDFWRKDSWRSRLAVVVFVGSFFVWLPLQWPIAAVCLVMLVLPPVWRILFASGSPRRLAWLVTLWVCASCLWDFKEGVQEVGFLNAVVSRPYTFVRETAAWARANTPKDAIFLVNVGGDPDWEPFRALSERSIFTSWEEGTAINWSPNFVVEWDRRMKLLGYDVRGGPPKRRNDLDHMYEKLWDEDIKRIRAEVPIRYWVVFEDHPSGYPAVFNSRGFKVLDLEGEIVLP